MIDASRRAGFTLLEILVAVMLLGLLATFLIMFFRQSMIARSVGEAAVADSDRQRREIARAAQLASETIPMADEKNGPKSLRVLSAWDAEGKIRSTRPLAKTDTPLPEAGGACRKVPLSPTAASSGELVTVVVTSAGPDGRWGTDDDLTTEIPEGVE